ncbi:hypothetical protein [Photobacterium leiognathi]|uniref:hypothetical protein n=1 Tax=Photobacterium leiognathi TaxID=553611 RepID=UPI002981C2A2|nr:hypothetical protein [Photobacterium leiognathi]
MSKNQIIDKRQCDDVDGTLVFELDNGQETLGIEITTILQMIRIAEDQYFIPALGDTWWYLVQQRYPELQVDIDECLQIKNK